MTDWTISMHRRNWSEATFEYFTAWYSSRLYQCVIILFFARSSRWAWLYVVPTIRPKHGSRSLVIFANLADNISLCYKTTFNFIDQNRDFNVKNTSNRTSKSDIYRPTWIKRDLVVLRPKGP